MYNCSFEDEVADIVKISAINSDRTVRGQFHYLLKLALKTEGLLPQTNAHKKADTIRQDPSASCTPA